MEDKVQEDIKAMIAKYDYQKAYEKAQKEYREAEAAKAAAAAALNKVKSLEEASADDLIQALVNKLKKMRE